MSLVNVSNAQVFLPDRAGLVKMEITMDQFQMIQGKIGQVFFMAPRASNNAEEPPKAPLGIPKNFVLIVEQEKTGSGRLNDVRQLSHGAKLRLSCSERARKFLRDHCGINTYAE